MASIKISELGSLTQKDYNDVIPIVDISANETKKVSIETLIDNNVKLIAVSDEEPSEATQGDKYYNTTSNKIFTYVGSGEWYDNGTPKQGILYIVFDEQSTYAYNGVGLVSVGGGQDGSLIIALKTITTAPITFVKGDKYYNSTDNLIYTATSSNTWNDGETADELTLYLNEYDNKLYRYYNNAMNLEGGSGGGSITVHDSYSTSTTEPYSANYVNNTLKWKLLQQVTGTTHISLPASFNELLVVGEVTQYHIVYTINIPYDYLETTQEKQYTNGYYSGAQDNGVYIVKAKLSELYLSATKVAGIDKTNVTNTTVYYR